MDMDPEKFVSAMKEGFDCRGCGTCCIVWKIPVTDEDITREPKLTEKVKDGFMEKGGHDLPCPFCGKQPRDAVPVVSVNPIYRPGPSD